MTPAERQERCRARRKASLPKPGTWERARLELWWRVADWASLHAVSKTDLSKLLDELGMAVKMHTFDPTRGRLDYWVDTGRWSGAFDAPASKGPLLGGVG